MFRLVYNANVIYYPSRNGAAVTNHLVWNTQNFRTSYLLKKPTNSRQVYVFFSQTFFFDLILASLFPMFQLIEDPDREKKILLGKRSLQQLLVKIATAHITKLYNFDMYLRIIVHVV